MFLKIGTLAVMLAIVAVGNAQQGPPGPPGVEPNRFPKFPGQSEAAAPGHNIPEEFLIYPEVPLNEFVAGARIDPDDPQQMIDPGPELHIFSDPRGPVGYQGFFRRILPGRDSETEYQYRDRRVDVQHDMEP